MPWEKITVSLGGPCCGRRQARRDARSHQSFLMETNYFVTMACNTCQKVTNRLRATVYLCLARYLLNFARNYSLVFLVRLSAPAGLVFSPELSQHYKFLGMSAQSDV